MSVVMKSTGGALRVLKGAVGQAVVVSREVESARV